MAYTIRQKFIHMAPRKLRLVADLVRGKHTDTALAQLAVLPKIAAQPIKQAVKAAMNAAKQKQYDGQLVVASIFIDEGPAMKRRIIKSRGRASRMEHRMSHITVVVAEAPMPTSTKAAKEKSVRKQPSVTKETT
jgi:large subunit ribosomal protein L22